MRTHSGVQLYHCYDVVNLQTVISCLNTAALLEFLVTICSMIAILNVYYTFIKNSHCPDTGNTERGIWRACCVRDYETWQE